MRVDSSIRALRLPVMTSLLALSMTTMASDPSLAADFSGKRIELIVPFNEGGGADTYARFVSPHLEKYLPGKPSIIIRNISGGGSITGGNSFSANSKPDGLHLFAMSSSTITSYLLRDERVKYKVEEDWMPIISSPSGIVVYASPSTGAEGKDPVADIGKLRKAQLIMGGKHIIASELGTLLSLDLLGVKVKAVFGLDRGPARLGFQRGEFNIAYDSAASYLAQAVPLVQKGEAIPLFTLGFMDQSGKVVRDPSFPDLPSFPEVYKLVLGKELAGPEYQAWLSIFSVNVMASKGLALPGGTSDEVITAYTDALRKAVADPDYKAHAAEFVGNYPQVIGKPAKQVVDAGATMNDEARSWLREWLRVNYDENIK